MSQPNEPRPRNKTAINYLIFFLLLGLFYSVAMAVEGKEWGTILIGSGLFAVCLNWLIRIIYDRIK